MVSNVSSGAEYGRTDQLDVMIRGKRLFGTVCYDLDITIISASLVDLVWPVNGDYYIFGCPLARADAVISVPSLNIRDLRMNIGVAPLESDDILLGRDALRITPYPYSP